MPLLSEEIAVPNTPVQGSRFGSIHYFFARMERLTLAFIALYCVIPTASADNTRFLNFFPVYRDDFIKIRDSFCAKEFALKQAGATICRDLFSCMLENTSEVIKGDMSSGIVALGLMPTILTFLGSSTAETVLLARRRPLLAFFLAAGSPAVNPLPTFVYPNPIEELKARENHLILTNLSSRQAVFVSILQYVLVLAAIANVYTAAFYTGYWTINTISCDDVWYPTFWVVTTLFIHLFGMWCLALRVKTNRNASRSVFTWKDTIREWITHEATPCVTHERLMLSWKPETYTFVAVSWWTSIITTVHLLYGTIAFSSVQFIGKTHML